MLRKKIIISLFIFIFSLISGIVGIWLTRGQITNFQLFLIHFVAIVFTLTMFFVIPDKTLRIEKNYIKAQTIINEFPTYKKIKRLLMALMALIVVGGGIFALYNPSKIRIIEITTPTLLFMLMFFYIVMLKRHPKGKIVANTLKNQINTSLKRGIIGGIVFTITIIIFLIIYFIYHLYTK